MAEYIELCVFDITLIDRTGVDLRGDIRQHVLVTPAGCDTSEPGQYAESGCHYEDEDGNYQYCLGDGDGGAVCMNYDADTDEWMWTSTDDDSEQKKQVMIETENCIKTEGKNCGLCSSTGVENKFKCN